MKFTSVLYRMRHLFVRLGIKIIHFPTPDVITGENCVGQLVARIQQDGLKKVLLVSDANLVKLGLVDGLKAKLNEEGIEFALFDDVLPNPTIQNAENARTLYLSEKCGGFVVVGGGSPMDCAKAAAARVVRPKKPLVKMRGQFMVMRKLPPFYAVPTTAGTGSETTAAAVITNPETHEKLVIVDLNLIPHVAVLDPAMTKGLPPFITATTGMDALTHAVEAYIGWHDTKFIKSNAEKAVKLIVDNLETAYRNGSDMEARKNMATASFHAGVAFTRASVGYVHSIAHNLGGMYNVSHGLANAVVFPYVLEAYGDMAAKKLANLAVAGGIIADYKTPAEGAAAMIAKIREFNQNMGIPDFIDELQEKDILLLAERVVSEGNPAYPVPKILYQGDFTEILKKLLKP